MKRTKPDPEDSEKAMNAKWNQYFWQYQRRFFLPIIFVMMVVMWVVFTNIRL